MKTLIIYAHPDTGGHCAAILDEVTEELKKRKQDFELLDLYKMKYDPILHENEHYTRGNQDVSKQNKDIQKKISGSKHLIFIYPVWWGSMPAILKGFFDRVFVSGYAFRYKGLKLNQLLRGRKAAVFITKGAPLALAYLVQGNRPQDLIKKDILGFCGIRAKVLQLGNATRWSESKRPKIRKLVDKGLRFLY